MISAIVGVTGLEATYEAIRAGKRVGLANKEALVSAGKLVMDAVRAHGAELIPVLRDTGLAMLVWSIAVAAALTLAR